MIDILGTLIGYGLVWGPIVAAFAGVACILIGMINAYLVGSHLVEIPLPRIPARTKKKKASRKHAKVKKCHVPVVHEFADEFKLPEVPFS
jgi:hypothetical protein